MLILSLQIKIEADSYQVFQLQVLTNLLFIE